MRQNVYSVAQVNSYIKNMFTQDYMLRYLLVKGEISNCKYHSSGHIYFTLKDAKGVIACVMLYSGANMPISSNLRFMWSNFSYNTPAPSSVICFAYN